MSTPTGPPPPSVDVPPSLREEVVLVATETSLPDLIIAAVLLLIVGSALGTALPSFFGKLPSPPVVDAVGVVLSAGELVVEDFVGLLP